MARKIVVTGGKGGVGKTTLAVYLSLCLAKKGERVALCDADFGLNNADVALGLESQATYDVIDVIEGRCRAKQALVKHPYVPNFYLLTSSCSSPERYVSPQAVKAVLESLSSQFDFIIIDCPAGLEEGFHRAIALADEAIVVTTPHIAALRDADKVITALKSYKLNDTSLVVNMVRGELLTSGECLSPVEVSELLKIPLLGVLPEEYTVYAGEHTNPHVGFKMIANNLLTGKRKFYDVTKKYSGLLGNIRRVLKRRL